MQSKQQNILCNVWCENIVSNFKMDMLCLNSFDSENLMADSEYDVPYFSEKG